MRSSLRWGSVLATVGLLAIGLAYLPSLVSAFQEPDFRDSPFLRVDPARITLDQRDSRVPCGECHTAEYEVWQETTHSTGFETMHRTESAQDILREMGLNVTKRQESLCMRCHYTVKAPQLRAVAGVSCESCHGPALDWLDIHNQWGPGVDHPDNEAPDHQSDRITQSAEGGMLRPSGDLYAVAANCFECHTVPFEDLVNVGGHTPGSSDFELVSRIDEIQHNFVEAQWGGSNANQDPTEARSRVTFVVGRILDFEFSVRALAGATEEGRFSKSMGRRISGATQELESIARVVEIPEVMEILNAARDIKKVPDNRDALLASADRVRALGQAFTAAYSGDDLAALDPLVAGEAVAAPPPIAAEPPADPGTDDPVPPPAGADPVDAPPTPAATTAAAAPAPELPGRVRPQPEWFPESSPYETLADPDDCTSCHIQAEDWWYDDTHSGTAQRLLNREARAVEIAQLYGLSVDQMTKGNQMCMSCHGTVESAAPNTDVLTGVSCESCHGPASGYRDPHEDGGNPQLGMVDLKDPAGRAANCVRCHHITDDRLLAAGHPSGSDYDAAAADQQIEHWPDERRVGRARERRGESYPGFDRGAFTAAFAAARNARPVPQVAVVSPPPRATPTQVAPTQTAPPRATATGDTQTQVVSSPPERLTPRPAPRNVPSATTPTTGGAEPVSPEPAQTGGAAVAAPDSTEPPVTTEDLLLDVKRRLEALFRRLGRGG